MGTVSDAYYWISHYVFHDEIPKNAIKKKIKLLYNQHLM